MYYRFAILLLFRPYVAHSIAGSSISPRDVCFEAANDISALVQSYAQLYTLRRTPSFITHFILTSSIFHLSIAPGLFSPLDRRQSQLQLANQVIDAIRQTVADLAAISPCHRSAQRAHYLVGILAKKGNIVLNARMSLDFKGCSSAHAGGSLTVDAMVLEEELSSKWETKVGRFVGMSQTSTSGVRDLQNPPFWLIYRHARAVLPSRAVLEASGFFALR